MEPDDKQLVDDARRGNAAAFRELVVRHQRRAYAVALGMVHDPDDARDVCQDAFLKVHKSLATFEGESQFFTWLYRIVTNLCIDHLRKKRGQQVEFDETVAQGDADDAGVTPHRTGFDPARALSDKELRAQILGALAKLTPSHRLVLVMREVEGQSYQEMAATMNCSIGTIMSRLFHARKKMQAMLIEARKAATPAA